MVGLFDRDPSKPQKLSFDEQTLSEFIKLSLLASTKTSVDLSRVSKSYQKIYRNKKRKEWKQLIIARSYLTRKGPALYKILLVKLDAGPDRQRNVSL